MACALEPLASATQISGWPVRADENAILADIRRRDERDTARAVAPLRPAADAHVLDTSDLAIDGVVAAAIDIIEGVRRNAPRPSGNSP